MRTVFSSCPHPGITAQAAARTPHNNSNPFFIISSLVARSGSAPRARRWFAM
jgi:hypothetical protein